MALNPLLRIALPLCAVACAAHEDRASGRSDPQPPGAAVKIAAVDSLCTSDSEPIALRCDNGVARRVGDTLFIRMAAKETAFVNNETDGEQHIELAYAGRVAPSVHVLWMHFYESVGAMLFDARTKQDSPIEAVPVLSPNGQRFVSATSDLDVCEGQTAMTVWENTATFPVKRWSWESPRCGSDAEWGPEAVKWRGNDTIEITRVLNDTTRPHAADSTRRRSVALLVKADTGWRLILHP